MPLPLLCGGKERISTSSHGADGEGRFITYNKRAVRQKNVVLETAEAGGGISREDIETGHAGDKAAGYPQRT